MSVMKSYFKKIRSLKIPVNRQGFLHYMCLGYANLPKELKELIDNTINDACRCEEDRKMMKEYLFTEKSLIKVALDSFASERKIYRLRAKIFSQLYKKIYIDGIFQ